MNSWLQKVYESGFAKDDAVLYLDTHPDCAEALSYYQKTIAAYEAAVSDYVRKVGPLFPSQAVDSAEACSHWSWQEAPWPWEGGVC